MEEVWRLVLGYIISFHSLIHGWIYFKVKISKDVYIFLGRHWLWGPSRLSLIRWKLGFDPQKEPSYLQQI
jgi:hypothetical protein